MKRIMAVLFASTLLMAAACSTSDSSKTSSSTFNDADVTFVQGMIPHHKQAVEMADLALKNGQSAKVKDLAKKIKGEQDPEIKTMKGFLGDWGKKESGKMGGMDHSGDSAMTGMMSDKDMTSLEAASGPAFDMMFLKMMTKHHEGAVSMAKTEQSDGKSAPAKELAGNILKAQKAEITDMKALLKSGA